MPSDLAIHPQDQPRHDPPVRAVWALNATGGLDEKTVMGLLDDGDELIRGWAIRLLCDRGPPSAEARSRLVSLARSDPAPRVRLNLASALHRIPVNGPSPLLSAGRVED